MAAILLMLGSAASAEPGRVRRGLSPELAGQGLLNAIERLRGSAEPAPRAIPVNRQPAPRGLAVPTVKTIPARPIAPIEIKPQPQPQPAPEPVRPPVKVEPRGQKIRSSQPVDELLAKCRYIAAKGYPYIFGAESPAEGGFDCSGVIHYLLNSMGKHDVPRVAYDQYRWLEKEGTLKPVHSWTSADRLFKRLQPGDLLFWTGTYQTGRTPNISHVMIYMGLDRTSKKPMMFGARSSKLRGANGHSVDIFPFVYPKTGSRAKFVGYGRIPGL